MKPKTVAVAFASGLLFGVGLLLSGMADPAKVLAFLDLAGAWDPSLILVMGGALAVALLGFRGVRAGGTTPLGEPLNLPTATRVDGRLVAGSLLFGAGWGLAGLCPGPALVRLGAGLPDAALFVAAMLAGMALHRVVFR
ncbi:hypothetical protein EV683_10694 [Crenobacter luteus]|uniref:YeeE/YedE family protein n=1 Tax=Crenobacter luteus TaxID=1452487 RepID=A0A165FH66_9NEIS|nr:DUF6691 family protein [Crenobacter luteus]KZE33255.1 hypothetical protein AVW16_08775 [Crenobacter luteus]TCP13659.1 hypothetical protein EV683_10694 [Crenobacter luteus]